MQYCAKENYDMQDGYNYNKPRRRRRRKRINVTAIFFWFVVLMAVTAVIVMLVKPKDKPSVEIPTEPDDSYNEQWQPSATQKPQVTLPIVPETDPPTNPPTDPPATNPPATNPPTNPPTEPPTEPPTDPPTEPPTEPEETAGIDDPGDYASVGEAAVAVAKSALGLPFEMGGAGPKTFDTSGLIQFCFKESGVSIPRLVSEQAAYGTEVSKDELKPGDVVFFSFEVNTGKAEYPGIYIGDGNFIAARSSANKIDTLSMNSGYYDGRFVCARRYY